MADVNNDGRISHDDLLRLVRYEAETGLFFARQRLTPRVAEGDQLGCVHGHGYVMVGLKGRVYRAHRLAWFYVHGRWPEGGVDHIDGNRTHNAIANLREADVAQNNQNFRRATVRNKSGLLGVVVRGDKYEAVIRAEGVDHSLGRFTTPEEAHTEYVRAKRELHNYGTL